MGRTTGQTPRDRPTTPTAALPGGAGTSPPHPLPQFPFGSPPDLGAGRPPYCAPTPRGCWRPQNHPVQPPQNPLSGQSPPPTPYFPPPWPRNPINTPKSHTSTWGGPRPPPLQDPTNSSTAPQPSGALALPVPPPGGSEPGSYLLAPQRPAPQTLLQPRGAALRAGHQHGTGMGGTGTGLGGCHGCGIEPLGLRDRD